MGHGSRLYCLNGIMELREKSLGLGLDKNLEGCTRNDAIWRDSNPIEFDAPARPPLAKTARRGNARTRRGKSCVVGILNAGPKKKMSPKPLPASREKLLRRNRRVVAAPPATRTAGCPAPCGLCKEREGQLPSRKPKQLWRRAGSSERL